MKLSVQPDLLNTSPRPKWYQNLYWRVGVAFSLYLVISAITLFVSYLAREDLRHKLLIDGNLSPYDYENATNNWITGQWVVIGIATGLFLVYFIAQTVSHLLKK